MRIRDPILEATDARHSRHGMAGHLFTLFTAVERRNPMLAGSIK